MVKGKTKFLIMITTLILITLLYGCSKPTEPIESVIETYTPPPESKPTSSQFGRKVNYPNTNEGIVEYGQLASYVIGQYKAEYLNYDNLLADNENSRKIASVVDPSLTAARSRFPQDKVRKDIYNGFMTVRVHEYLGMKREFDIDEEFPYYGNPVYALNFDLHTGDKVDLRSVFADGFDAQKAVDKAVQPYVLAHDELNVRKFRGVDLENTAFTVDLTGVWLIFDSSSPFLANKSVFIEWYKFGDGAVAIFDRFAPLSDADIAPDFSSGEYYSEDKLLYRSEPKQLVVQNTTCYLPTNYENEYERGLIERAREILLMSKPYEGNPYMSCQFDRIGNYRVVYVSGMDLSSDEYKPISLKNIFNINEKREITASEYYGKNFENLVLEAFRDVVNYKSDNAQRQESRVALVSETELLELLKSAEFDYWGGYINFPQAIYSITSQYEWEETENTEGYYYLSLGTNYDWWR